MWESDSVSVHGAAVIPPQNVKTLGHATSPFQFTLGWNKYTHTVHYCIFTIVINKMRAESRRHFATSTTYANNKTAGPKQLEQWKPGLHRTFETTCTWRITNSKAYCSSQLSLKLLSKIGKQLLLLLDSLWDTQGEERTYYKKPATITSLWHNVT